MTDEEASLYGKPNYVNIETGWGRSSYGRIMLGVWNEITNRIYRELELNLQIKPRKRLKREKSEPLTVPEQLNITWSIDFMADQPAGAFKLKPSTYASIKNKRITRLITVRLHLSNKN